MFIPPIEVAKGSHSFSISYTIPSPELIKQIQERKVINIQWIEKEVSDTEVCVQGEWDIVFSYLTQSPEELKVMQVTQPFSMTIPIYRLQNEEVSSESENEEEEARIEIVDLVWINQPQLEEIKLIGNEVEAEELGENEAAESLYIKITGVLEARINHQKGQKINIRSNEVFLSNKPEIFGGTNILKSRWCGEIRSPKEKGGDPYTWNRLSWRRGRRRFF